MIDYLKPIKEKRRYYEEHPELVAKKMMAEVRKHMLINYFDFTNTNP